MANFFFTILEAINDCRRKFEYYSAECFMHSGRMLDGTCVICELVSEVGNLLHCLLTNKQQGKNFIINVFCPIQNFTHRVGDDVDIEYQQLCHVP